jgi:hypothetical protein
MVLVRSSFILYLFLRAGLVKSRILILGIILIRQVIRMFISLIMKPIVGNYLENLGSRQNQITTQF